MNGIFHNCAQKVYQYGALKENIIKKKQYKKGLKWNLEFYKSVCRNY